MSTPENWALTPREFQARAKVRELYMADWRSELRNAPHFTRSDKRAWLATDFLPSENKPQLVDKPATLFAQAELGLLQNNPDMVPDWAKGPYKRREKVVAIG